MVVRALCPSPHLSVVADQAVHLSPVRLQELVLKTVEECQEGPQVPPEATFVPDQRPKVRIEGEFLHEGLREVQ